MLGLFKIGGFVHDREQRQSSCKEIELNVESTREI